MCCTVQIDTAGDFGLRVHNPSRKQHRILPVDISLNTASYLITVGKATLAPPYRVENRCKPVWGCQASSSPFNLAQAIPEGLRPAAHAMGEAP